MRKRMRGLAAGLILLAGAVAGCASVSGGARDLSETASAKTVRTWKQQQRAAGLPHMSGLPQMAELQPEDKPPLEAVLPLAAGDERIGALLDALPEDLDVINSAGVADINGDGLPEVLLGCSGGWEYRVYYYSGGQVLQVEDLTAWTWSSELLANENGDLVLGAWAHTTGTAGYLEYKVYRWEKERERYVRTQDLYREPAEYERETPVTFTYYCTDYPADWDGTTPPPQEEIGAEKFGAAIDALGSLSSIELRMLSHEDTEDVPAILEDVRELLRGWELPDRAAGEEIGKKADGKD